MLGRVGRDACERSDSELGSVSKARSHTLSVNLHTRTTEYRELLTRFVLRLLGTALVLMYFGPFWSRDSLLPYAVESAASPFNQVYPANSQDEIAVVLVDDGDLTQMKKTWPLPYPYWAQALQRIACSGARIVFFDLLLGDEDKFLSTEDGLSLASLDMRLARGPLTPTECGGRSEATHALPVYYAFSKDPTKWLAGLVSDDRKLPVTWAGVQADYPVTVTDFGRSHASVAAELFRVRCMDKNGPQPLGCALPLSRDEQLQRMLPRWTQRIPIAQTAILDVTTCRVEVPNHFPAALLQFIRQLFSGPQMAKGCKPFATVNLSRLLQDFDGSIAAVLKDRIVLVGADVTAASDVVNIPSYNQLPGVYIHATALENLLSLGQNFDRIEEDTVRAWAFLAILLTVFLVTIPKKKRSPHPQPRAACAGWRRRRCCWHYTRHPFCFFALACNSRLARYRNWR